MYATTSSGTKRNVLRAINFETPDYIPMTFHINDACWNSYDPEVLLNLIENHPFLFPEFKRTSNKFPPKYALNARKGKPYTDGFGCKWETTMDGIVGSVNAHPLSDWESYTTYCFPNPDKTDGLFPVDWEQFNQICAQKKARGEMVYGDLRHGHTFQQLIDLRGYENVLFDMMDEEPRLLDLICRLEDFNLKQIDHFIQADVDIVRIPEDLGMQSGPMLSPDNFSTYIRPSYRRLIKTVRDAGILVHMHSDGNIRLLSDMLVEDGVNVLNLQDRVNGVDWISSKYRGRVCIDLDIDRQFVTPYGTPREIDDLILEEVRSISCREGGLMMIYGLYPGIPIENIKATMDAMEKYAFYWS